MHGFYKEERALAITTSFKLVVFFFQLVACAVVVGIVSMSEDKRQLEEGDGLLVEIEVFPFRLFA